jgi:hypothetical protein
MRIWRSVRLCGRAATGEQIQARQDDRDGEEQRNCLRRIENIQSKNSIECKRTISGIADNHGKRDVQRIQFPTVRGEKPLANVNGEYRDQHHRRDERWAERAAKTERNERSTARLAQTSKKRERAAWTKPDPFEESARSGEPIATKPSEELLGPMANHRQAYKQPDEKQHGIHCTKYPFQRDVVQVPYL